MTGFYLAAGLMLLVALAFVLVPLLGRARTTSGAPSEFASNVALFRARKQEIEEDFAQGNITLAERDAALAELTDRVADEIPKESVTHATAPTQRAWRLGVVATLVLSALAATLYGKVGNLSALHPGNNIAQHPAAQPDAPVSDKQIMAMVDALAQKMEANPSDPKGWLLLARSQNALGRPEQAVQAFERALSLLPKRGAEEAFILADYADALVVVQQGKFDGKPYALIQEALKLDPNHPKALALAGTAEMRAGKREASLKHWHKLKSVLPPDSDDAREVAAIIAEVSGEPVTASPPANAKPAPANVGARITGSVTIAPELISKIGTGDTLFVFARAANGSKMPLAILRAPVPAKWPFPFELTDAMAMAPGANISSASEVQIEARISKSGGAAQQPGDLAGQSTSIKTGTGAATGVTVTIAKVVP